MRDVLIDRGLNVLSVRRSFTTIKAIINLAIAEHGLDMRNPFSSIFMPEAYSKKRVSIPVETIREIQQACYDIDDDRRWLEIRSFHEALRISLLFHQNLH